MKNRKGITLISLVITVIVLAILASIATYSGINVIRSSKFTAFTAELKIMQTHVNALYEEDKGAEYGTAVGDAEAQVQEQATKVFGASGITDNTGYCYWSEDYIKNTLKIEGVEQAFFVNLEKRSVVSYEGLEYEGKTYYTLEQIPNGLYNIDYETPTAGTPTFDVKTETIGDNKWRVTISNIQYEGYIDKWQVSYQLEGKEYWNTTEDLSFVIEEQGNYKIKLENGKVESSDKSVRVMTTIEEAKRQDKLFEKNTTLKDNFENKIVVPEGFKIAQDSSNNVTEGVVIEDVSYGETAGSQFVWIPVGEIYKNSDKTENVTINLDRYTFDSNGVKTVQGEQTIGTYYQELATSSYGNTTAKNINDFKTSVKNNNGYYIGRYEARVKNQRTAKTDNDSELEKATVKAEDFVYYNITQLQAAKLSQDMYKNTTFTSDLSNSYAWDTAIVFLQEFDNRTDKSKPYSRQNSLNTSHAEKGTNNLEDLTKQDKICNIWDMASNNMEWTTETSNAPNAAYVYRGGRYISNNVYTNERACCSIVNGYSINSFRILLYL